ADNSGFEALAVLQNDFDRVGGFDDVVVGDYDAVRRNDEPGPQRSDLRAALAQAFVQSLHRRAWREAREVLYSLPTLARGDVHNRRREPLVRVSRAPRWEPRRRWRGGGESENCDGGQNGAHESERSGPMRRSAIGSLQSATRKIAGEAAPHPRLSTAGCRLPSLVGASAPLHVAEEV